MTPEHGAAATGVTAQPAARRVGLLGGTFDPLHVGHLIVAHEARAALELDTVLFAPAGSPPHKTAAALTPAATRRRMLELALSDEPAFALCAADLDRPGPHYTVDLLDIVAAANTGAALYFIMGADALADLPTWRDPEGIVARAVLVVAPRPGRAGDLPALAERVGHALPGLRQRLVLLDLPAIGVSATDLRARVRSGRPIRYQVPEAVRDFLAQERLYRS